MFDSLGIDCEILEASDRVGGRLSTYKFPNGEKYDYYVRTSLSLIEGFDVEHIQNPRKQGRCASHFRRRILMESIRTGP